MTVGVTGPLLQLDLYVADQGTARISVNEGEAWQSDEHDFTTEFTAPRPGWASINTFSAGLDFDVGDEFAIEIAPIDDSNLCLGGSLAPPGGGYGGGTPRYKSTLFEGGDADIAFRTWVIPDAATIVLLGLGGFALLRKRPG